MQFSLRKTEDIQDHILTVAFIFLAFVLMVLRHDGGLQSVRKVSVVAISYMEQPLAQFRVYRTALQTNEELGKQNIILQDELSRLRSVSEENRALRAMIGLQDTLELDLLPAKIVAKTLTGINNSVTVNKGSNDGVSEGMALINFEGLVGQVIITTPGHALVMPFSNALFRASARIQGNRAHGIVSWSADQSGELVMNYVPQTIDVVPGAVVETSGFSNRFPSGIPIGRVTRTRSEDGLDTQQVFVRPFVSLHQIAEAFVVRYEPEPEVEELLLQFEGLFQ
ncbi:rod shape-determining protein MreC [Balneolales bacterium ANBcel1]|nr:rod shape-determining protein MreC [Balneolales bacterium ANBcel1]